ncbi:SDR family NAD(P)-dependent oxidoreductase [Jiangella rhizosphaerae]|uniref:SDR family oxidoreductase n=1 Tax=Jiangella rhizosphaerae TaxID=2293569 RepID=A0A418KP06_9ACTN|nr:SDR family NAD(P)-dependent oxidoreductase [Jiangella rhizosphaerae]RIQ20643.1 SDR family oxidoreductase [Jiangella rhizosphaerae]
MTRPEHPVAIVTGGARGIGAAVAARLAREGHAVAVLDLDEQAAADTAAAISAAGGTALAVRCDIADEAAVTAATDQVVAALGPPTVLVNNAGAGPAAGITEMTVEQWDHVLGINLRGHFLVTRAVVGHLVAAGWGRIVTISSISAHGDDGRSHYSSAKAGLIGFTRSLALELGPHGVTVNAIAPGFIVSDMTAASAQRLGRTFEEHQRIAAESIPVGRVGRPEDIAHTASYLVSPEAGFVTGQVIHVAGGPVG